MLATIPSATVLGVDGLPVRVEVHAAKGLPGFTVVGQPDAACREARDRVRAAMLSSGLAWPNRRITVNLAPSGPRKVGAALDLAMAVGVAVATGQLEPRPVRDVAFLGELGLDGSVRRVPGLLSLVAAVEAAEVVVPADGFHEAVLAGRRAVHGVGSLAEVVAAVGVPAVDDREAVAGGGWPPPPLEPPVEVLPPGPDLADVRGQPVARRAVEVAAAGAHHLLLVGPPGAGKTMLAERLPGLLPDLHGADALDATRIHSAAGLRVPVGRLLRRPPFRAPHHGASAVALVGGGGAQLRPGEVSLAHGGVLFLDELGELPAAVLDALRTPLEAGVVRVSRAERKVTLPARFLLVGAMNPCPCGEGARPDRCRCSDAALARYARRLSGPLLDRFDLCLTVAPPAVDALLGGERGEASAAVAARVALARERAAQRGVVANGDLGGGALEAAAPLRPGAERLARRALETGRLTARGLRRIRAVALTLADLAGDDPPLGEAHVAEALALRAAAVGLRHGGPGHG